MRKSNREVNGEKVFRYSIRKCHFGAASVAVAALMFFANGAVKADTLPVSPATANTEKVNAGVTNLTEGVPLEKSLETEGNKEIVAPEPAAETSNKEDGAGSNAQGANDIKVSDKDMIPANQTEEINKAETNGKEEEVVVNKDKLESLLKEIDQLNLKDYTEDSVKVLQEKVAKAKEVLVNAKTQKEIDLAYNALVGYKNAGLKRVPKSKGELTPKPDTTNGKATVGIKAENTEPNGTNIAGHNHSLNGTTRAEGSGFRAVPEGDAYFNLDSGTLETEVGSAPNAKFLVVWRKRQGYKPQLTSDGLGIRLLYDRQIPDNDFVKRLFNTTGSINIVGSYDVAFEMKDGSTGVLYSKKDFKVTVKPQAPRVTVENLENAAGTRAKVTATARNPQYSSGEQPGESSVDFYVNGVKKQTVTAVNGVAEWTPTEVFNVNDRITATNTARDKHFLPSRGTNINVPITATTSNMSSEVVIPRPVTPTVNKDELRTATSTGDTETKASPAYYNAEASKKDAYDQAVTAGKEVLAKDNATQTEVNNALSAITNAKNALGGVATNKDELRTATSTGDTETKASPAYYNAEASKKDAYDQAVTAGKAVLAKDNATQTEVNNALSAITNAKNALGGVATNKDELRTATSTGDTETKASPAYYNAEASKKDAYDQAVTAGKAVLAKDNATQTEVNNALSAITNAKNALGGVATNKDELRTATSTGDTETKASPAYYNAEASKKDAYDQAVASGKEVLAKDNATQTEVNDAVSAITNAKNALGGVATNKDELRTATSTGDTETKASPAYYNAEASKKDAYDQAVTAGKAVLAKDNATQTEVNNALSAITNAKNALGGVATNKDELRTATSTGDTETKASPAYYNAEASKKDAYDQAVASGKEVLAKDNATQTEVNDAVSAITNAKNALGGVATNKDELRTATSTGDTETKASPAYYNAEASKKDAYDQAVTAGKAVLAKDNATQTEVNNALSAITNAKNALGGVATNKDELRTATSTGDTETKASPAYYNAEASKKDAYDQAVTAGKAVLAKDNATQTEVNNALSAITNAKNALGGVATNKDELRTATSTGDTETKASPAYYNAEASKKDAYDQAVTAGKAVLAKDNATQTEVNNALSAITNAKNALGGVATNKDELRTATSTGDTETKASPAYYNAEASKKAAYDQAVASGKEVLAKDNATQTEVNDAVSAITNAKNALGGVATNKDALRTATSTGDTETKATAVPSDDTTREPEVVTSNSQSVSSENNVLKQNDSESHATLPNTGTKEDRAAGALGILSLLGAFGLLFAKKKKDDEEEA